MKNFAYFSIIAIGVILALSYGQSMIIQFIIAYLLWFSTIQVKVLVNRSKILRKIIPEKLKSILILTVIIVILSLLINSIVVNLQGLIGSLSKYEANINIVAKTIEEIFHIDDVYSEINKIINELDIKSILSSLAETLSTLLSNSMMVLIYLLFIFLEYDTFNAKITSLFPESEKRDKFITTLRKIEKSLSRYFRVKTLVSLITATAGFITLWAVGLDSPLFWAFLIFLLNFIPTIGSLVATVLPALFSLLQFATFTRFIIILVIVGGIQQVVGNFVEPKLMGRNLNISPIVTIIALTIWGQLWGTMGMLLSVPMTVVMIIVMSQFESTQKVAILLSEKGKIYVVDNETESNNDKSEKDKPNQG